MKNFDKTDGAGEDSCSEDTRLVSEGATTGDGEVELAGKDFEEGDWRGGEDTGKVASTSEGFGLAICLSELGRAALLSEDWRDDEAIETLFASVTAGVGDGVEVRLLKKDRIPPVFFSETLGRSSFSSISGIFHPTGVSSFSV